MDPHRRPDRGARLLVALLLASCGIGEGRARSDDPPPPEAVSQALRAILDGGGPPLHRPAHRGPVEDGLATLYAPAADAVWTRAGRPTAQAAAAVRAIEEASANGLRPEDYDAAWLRGRLDGLSAGPAAPPAELAVFDAALSVEALRYLRALHGGRVRPTDVGFVYHVDLQGADLGERLRRALAEEGVERLAADLEPRFAQYGRLKNALARHRALPSDPSAREGVRKIELALERLRWLPHAPDGPFLVANVPAFRVVAFRSRDDERPALQMAIVVGKAARTQTPLFSGELSSVLFRPPWYPPPSILRNEILPRLGRDPGYLRREHMDIVAAASDGSPALPPTAANLARLRSGRLALRQNPGPHNALGLVKFVFPNDYRVYMHDTPARSLFARERRDFSHGCIRVERPAELAEFVLAAQPGWTRDRIEAAMNGTRTLRVEVAPAIPVFVFYTTVIVRADDTVEFFDDIYGLDALLDRALAASAAR